MYQLYDAIQTQAYTPRWEQAVLADQQFIVTNNQIDPVKLRRFSDLALAKKAPLILDIEAWPVNWQLIHDGLDVALTQTDGQVPVSFYGAGPVGGEIVHQICAGNFSAQQEALAIDLCRDAVAANNRASFLAPSLYYAHTTSAEQFFTAASYLISACRRQYPGRKIMPFISPWYSDQLDVHVPMPDWNTLLWTLHGSCDGFLVWGAPQSVAPNDAWLNAAQSFAQQT